MDELTGEVKRSRDQLDLAQKELAIRDAALQKQVGELQKELAAQAEKAAELARNRDALQQSLEESQKRIADLEGRLRADAEEAQRQQEALRQELDRWQKAAGDASSSLEQTQQSLQLGEKQKEKELSKISEQTEFMRGEMRVLRQRIQELEGQLASTESLRTDAGANARELKRLATQAETVQAEFARLQARAGQTEAVLRDFYAGSVNPLTIAKVSIDLIPTKGFAADDLDTINDLRKNIEQVLEVMRKLVAKMAELQIPIERPAQPGPGAPGSAGGPGAKKAI